MPSLSLGSVGGSSQVSRGARPRILAAAILTAALALRLADIGSIELGLDEYYSILTACAPAGVLHTLRNDPNPPLYYYVLRAWMVMFGDSELGARSLSAVCGVAFVAALGGLVRGLGLSSSAALWAMTVAALSPMQIYHSQQARTYTLLVVLIALNVWSLAMAVRRGGAARWTLYAALTLAGLYTHNQFLPLVPAAWLMAWAVGAGRAACVGLGVAHVAVAVLYAPWFVVVLRQADPAALEWLVTYWQRTPPLLAVPRSLEVMGIGGLMPPYFDNFSDTPGDAVRAASVAWFGLIAMIVLREARLDRDGPRVIRRAALFLGIGLIVTLGFQFAYSLLGHPIYLVGRYDMVAHPAYLGLAGLGLASLQSVLARRFGRIVSAAPMVVTAMLAFFALAPRYRSNLPPEVEWLRYPNRLAGEVLKTASGADDLVVCFGFGGAAILYEQRRTAFAARVTTFPRSTMEHLGWMNPRLALEPDDTCLRREARSLFGDEAARRSAAGGGPAYGESAVNCRIYAVLDAATVTAIQNGETEHPLARVASLFFEEARAAGWQIGRPPDRVADAMSVLSIYQLDRSSR